MTIGNAGAIDAYSTTAAGWQRGPGRIYDRLAVVLIGRSPAALAGAVVVDVGAGTGAASRAALAAGARAVVALDPSIRMLRAVEGNRPPAVVAEARALPVADGRVDVGVAAFSLNHLDDPLPALDELRRVLRPGGAMVVGTYAADDHHVAKQVVEDALRSAGWRPPDWYAWMREQAIPKMAREGPVGRLVERAGFTDIDVARLCVEFPDLAATDLVEWRLGMAQHATFVAGLPPSERARIADAAASGLAGAPPLMRSIIVAVARSPQDAADPSL